jgi:tripartite-type tricarboxylate transporter receptor subunit TctC
LPNGGNTKERMMIPAKTSIVDCMIAAVALTTAAPIFGQNYPSRPVRVIVPFSPGGGSDILARLLAPPLTERLGQPVVIDNRPSGSGILGADLVAKSQPDGYTLLAPQSGHAANAQLFTRLPYDPIKDFAPISLVIASPTGLFLHPSVPAKTVKELIAYAKANPGKINYGTSGPASGPHLNAELFSSMAGIQMNHVPYKGAGQVVTAILGNEVQFSFTNIVSARPHWLSGRLRFIAHANATRLAALPEVPTITESGLPGFESRSWWGYMATRKTPRSIIERLHKEITAAANLPNVKQTYNEQGVEVVANTPDEFAKIIQADADKWGAIGKRLGIRLD